MIILKSFPIYPFLYPIPIPLQSFSYISKLCIASERFNSSYTLDGGAVELTQVQLNIHINVLLGYSITLEKKKHRIETTFD